jgi:hypothetical protein
MWSPPSLPNCVLFSWELHPGCCYFYWVVGHQSPFATAVGLRSRWRKGWLDLLRQKVVGRSTALSSDGCANRLCTWRLVTAPWGHVTTAVWNGGYRSCRRLNRREVPAALSNDGWRLVLKKYRTPIYFPKIVEKYKKILVIQYTTTVGPIFLLTPTSMLTAHFF